MSDITTETVTLSAPDGTTLPAYVARPSGDPAAAGILVFQEAFGVNEHIKDVTERFARAGYTAIAPALFHRTDANFEGSYTDFGPVMEHMSALTTEGLTADVQAAYEWMLAPAGGWAKVVGAIGYCLGGRVAFLANATVPVKVAVSYYGGGIAPSERGPGLLDKVNDVQAPMLLVWGGLDSHIGADQRQAIEDSLKAAGKNYTNVVFGAADHGFFCDARAAYEPNASRQAWALTLEYLATYLR